MVQCCSLVRALAVFPVSSSLSPACAPFLFISIVCYPIFDFLIHSFIYLFAFQALLTFRPALAEVLQLTELGRKRGSGSNACFFKPLVSAVLTNITQQV